jgi:hypothetical protein
VNAGQKGPGINAVSVSNTPKIELDVNSEEDIEIYEVVSTQDSPGDESKGEEKTDNSTPLIGAVTTEEAELPQETTQSPRNIEEVTRDLSRANRSNIIKRHEVEALLRELEQNLERN